MAQETFGAWLAGARTRKGWSQEELATATRGEVSVKTISALEQGRILDPRLSTVTQLSGALGVSFFTERQRYSGNEPKEAKSA